LKFIEGEVQDNDIGFVYPAGDSPSESGSTEVQVGDIGRDAVHVVGKTPRSGILFDGEIGEGG